MNSKFGQRYIQATKFCDYANAVIVGKSISLHDLEFLEREQLLLPVCRVRFPEKVVRKFWVDENSDYKDASLPIETDQNTLNVADTLRSRIEGWGTACLKPHHIIHPLDERHPTYQAFVQSTFTKENFKPWSTFKVAVGKHKNTSLCESYAHTYYHYWHVFVLAEIYNMGVSITLNLADKDLLYLASEGKFRDIPKGRAQTCINFLGLHSLREFPDHRNIFEALAFFQDYSKLAQFRASMKSKKSDQHSVVYLEGELLAEYISERDRIAKEALSKWGVNHEDILECIKWQCKRWAEWDRLDRQLIANEYKRNIHLSIDYYMLITGKEYDQVIKGVGRATSHFKPTLDVIFPQWLAEQKEDAFIVFKSWIMPTMEDFLSVGHNFDELECREMVEWIVEQNQIQILWYLEHVNKCWRNQDIASLTALRKTVEGLSSSFEHILNSIASKTNGITENRNLFAKVKWLWGDVDCVVHLLGINSNLTRSDDSYMRKWDQINNISSQEQYMAVVQDILKAVLIRNHGLHLSLNKFGREELLEFIRVLLRNVALAWKHARSRGLI